MSLTLTFIIFSLLWSLNYFHAYIFTITSIDT